MHNKEKTFLNKLLALHWFSNVLCIISTLSIKGLVYISPLTNIFPARDVCMFFFSSILYYFYLTAAISNMFNNKLKFYVKITFYN